MEETTNKEFEKPVFKHFFKTKSMGGFLTITPFNEGRKFNIEVGEVGADDKLKQVTNAYVEFVNLAAFLRAVVRGTASEVYRDPKVGPATFTQFGGALVDNKPVSRVLKITPMFTDFNAKVYDTPLPFQWKCGHFEAKKTGVGAFIPNMGKPLQQNGIKISRQTMEEISYLVDNHILKVDLGVR
jgi:hypothetical protein